MKDWNGSAEKSTWLASDNYQAFSRSRLFLRFHDAQQEGAKASSDGVFVITPRAITLLGARPWDVAAARAAMESIMSKMDRVWVTTADRLLILSTSEDLMKAMAGRPAAAIPPAHYAMRFLHAR